MAEFSGEGGCETGVSVRNNACGKSIMWEYMSGIKFGSVFAVDGFVAGNKNRCFRESVCDRKYSIVRFGKGEFDDEVHGYRSKWCVVSVRCDGKQGWFCFVRLIFPGLTRGATPDVFGNVLLHCWPPKVLCDCPCCV